MPVTRKHLEATKGEELKTYKAIGLGRAHKFIRERKRLERAGVWRVIGGDRADRPAITVRSKEYWEVRFRVTEEILTRPDVASCEIPIGVLLDGLQPRIEEETYRRMERQRGGLTDRQVDAALGRKGSEEERSALRGNGAKEGYAAYRSALLDEVIGKVAQHQRENPNRLQDQWKEVAGAVANESCLERIENGVAWIRTVNRALGFELSRRADLSKRLTEVTGQTVKRLRVV